LKLSSRQFYVHQIAGIALQRTPYFYVMFIIMESGHQRHYYKSKTLFVIAGEGPVSANYGHGNEPAVSIKTNYFLTS
jgi:hypothetical protein